jgi:hypothetical protein
MVSCSLGCLFYIKAPVLPMVYLISIRGSISHFFKWVFICK